MTSWGNYHAYQGPARHPGTAPSSPHVLDPRLSLLASHVPDLFKAKRVLDIGCNSGSVATQLGLNFDAICVHGVDVDELLVAKAKRHYDFRRSRVQETPTHSLRSPDYYPISSVLKYGPRDSNLGPQDVSAPSSTGNFPRCVRFYSEDWTVSDRVETNGPFNVITAFSVVKWIHLEHGDTGLEQFFEKCARSLLPEGHMIIEVQPWQSYEKAVHKNKAPHFQQTLGNLRYLPEDFPAMLKRSGLQHLFTLDALPRDISVYQKNGSIGLPT